MEKYKVYYFGHSAWAVETEHQYLFFDCQDENARSGGLLADGWISLTDLSDKSIYLFFSHRHHDHYSPLLHGVGSDCKDITTVLGDFSTPVKENTITMRPRETKQLNGLTVYTAASTDEGVCFLVQTEDVTLFFGGDNADWGDGDYTRQLYRDEIDYLAGLKLSVNLAFIPVCYFSGQRSHAMTEGAIYAIKALAPDISFPMHANGREQLYDAFEKDLRHTGRQDKVICAHSKGLVYHSNNE